MGGGDDQAAAGEVVAASGRRTGSVRRHRAPRSARPAARSAAAPPAAARSRAAAAARPTETPPADARHGRARPRPGFRAGVENLAAEKIPPERQVFQHAQAPASARRGGRDNGPVRARSARASPPSSSIDPPASVRRPAISRSSEVLPDPLGPVTASASPEAASKSRPENTSRPPRTHLTPRPESRILPFHSPLESYGYRNEFVGTALLRHDCRCGGASGIDSISRNLMQHTIRGCKPSGQALLTVF